MICFYPPFTWIMVLTLNNYDVDVQKTCFSQLNGFGSILWTNILLFIYLNNFFLGKLPF